MVTIDCSLSDVNPLVVERDGYILRKIEFMARSVVRRRLTGVEKDKTRDDHLKQLSKVCEGRGVTEEEIGEYVRIYYDKIRNYPCITR
jgi:hypothetical protein|tara:strand:+ start:60 stop:323 length:264 start_codon:yes stop_codon:yes gene_type:complete